MLLQLAQIFLDVLTPVFTLVAIGYLAGPRLKLEARTMSRYAYYLLTPAFTFNIISTARIEASVVTRMTLFIVAVHLGCVLVALGIGRLLRRPPQTIAAFALIAVFGNVGNFGLPVIEFRLGPEALVPASLYFLAISTFAFIIGVAAANWHSGGGLGAALAVFKTPALLAIIPAALLNMADVAPPLFVSRAVTLLAGAMIPTMLVTLGVQMAGMGRPRLSWDVLTASGVRLLGGPILATLLVVPFGLTGLERGAGILQASMPAAVLASLIALEYDLLPDFVTTTVLFSTLASTITLTIVLSLI